MTKGQVIRLLLEHLGVEYKERLYDQRDASVWFETDKHALGLEFPNLPYFLDGDFKLTEYCAILRYIAEKYDTVGKTLQERAKVSMLESAASELRVDIIKMAISAHMEDECEKFLKRVPIILKHWSSFLGDKPFLLGDSPLYVDFMLYENLDVLLYLERAILDATEKLVLYKKRIEELPAIKAYMNSERFIKWPLHAWHAAFGGGDAPPAQ
ncbi:unnamed protein product [Dicrocoelium dendriticum]|nr:unnamed protein product [Dicrocoelium dendriticum]CAH8506437.1 unnamed protein product [Dicrocoelium dendriticum]